MLNEVELSLLKQLGVSKVKICSSCREAKSLDAFEPNSRYADGYRGQCRCCRLLDGKNYYHKNADAIKAKTMLIQLMHPREYWVYSTVCGHKRRGCAILFNKHDLIKLAYATSICKVCGCELSWSREGKNGSPLNSSPTLDRTNQDKVLTMNNIQIICSRCNVTKNARSMNEFRDYCKLVAERV